MSIESGLIRTSKARKHIERLRDRLEYLQDSIAEAIDLGEHPNPYWQPEVDALEWALPVLEAEWDHVARLNRNVDRVENRLRSFEKRGRGVDPHSAPTWDLPVA